MFVINNDDEDVNQYWQSLDDGRSVKINERAFDWNMTMSIQCQSKELHQTLGGHCVMIDCSKKILRVPILLHFFSEFHFCYCHCCAGFSFLSGDVNVRRCRFSEIAIHRSSQFLSNIDRKKYFLFILLGAPLNNVWLSVIIFTVRCFVAE